MSYLSHSPRRAFWKTVVILANLLVVTGLLWSAFGATFDPVRHSSGGLMALTLPVWLLAEGLMLLVDILVWPLMAALPLIGALVCIDPILDFAPIGLGRYAPPRGTHVDTLRLMSYNIYSAEPLDGVYPEGTNPTMSYIMRENPDIAVLQECEMLSPWRGEHITRAQIDTLDSLYPFKDQRPETAQGIVSRYPLRRIKTPQAEGHRITAYDVTLPSGDLMLLINVHLHSIGLTRSDKELYGEVTSLEPKRGIRARLLRKMAWSGQRRAEEGAIIRSIIDSLGRRNVIVAGDFNDVQGCHAMRLIQGDDMQQAWRQGARGPGITYHLNRMYFRIDHALSRGDLRVMDTRRGTYAGSDHYPVLVTYALPRRGR